jgi:hypothetical protein
MSSLPDIPLSREAADLLERITPRILERLDEVRRVPVSILIWGPGIDSAHPLVPVRANLRLRLRENGHAALYSEELCDPSLGHSVRMQQLAQAQVFDLIVSTPGTPGSIGEIHDFVADSRVNSKILLFLNSEYLDGYSNQSLEALQTILSCQIEYYPSVGETSIIEDTVLRTVQRIREMKYLMAGRF